MQPSSTAPRPFILILLTIMGLISLYLVFQPLQEAQTKTVASKEETNNNNNVNQYDDSLGYRIVKRIDRNLSELFYTQGFKFKDSGVVAESAGLYGESEIHYIDTKKLTIVQRNKLDSKYFGEGLAFFTNSKNEEEIHQMTWRERKVIIYNAKDLTQKRIADLPQQMSSGWGLATTKDKDGKSIFLATDGSSYIFYIQPEDWSVIKSIQIHDAKNKPVTMLNDLDIIEDKILVNLYLTARIVELELETGKYVREYDFKQLKDEVFGTEFFKKNKMDNQYCLNGIAYDKKDQKIWITGKKWPFIYEVEFDSNKKEKF